MLIDYLQKINKLRCRIMKIKDLSDEQLVNFLNKGEESAITEIYNRYWEKLLAIAFIHTKDKDAAEEIVQQVLINLWDRRSTLKIGSLQNYLASAVKYAVIHSIQRYERRAVIANNELTQQTNNFSEQEIYVRFLNEYINGLVDKLPEKCKIVFKYSRQEGKNTAEIASELNIAEKTVEAHLTKAIKFIRISLKNIDVAVFIVAFSHYLK